MPPTSHRDNTRSANFEAEARVRTPGKLPPTRNLRKTRMREQRLRINCQGVQQNPASLVAVLLSLAGRRGHPSATIYSMFLWHPSATIYSR
jgi:hypothetical protein